MDALHDDLYARSALGLLPWVVAVRLGRALTVDLPTLHFEIVPLADQTK